MKYSAVVVLALSSFAFGAISDLPECAQKAISAAVTSTTSCSLDDQACQCTPANKAAIQGAATTGVLADCGADKALEVLAAANKACEDAASEPSVTPSETPSATPTPSETPSASTSKSTTAEPTTTTTIIESTTVATTTSTSTKASLTPSPSANGTISATPTPKPSEVNGASQLAAGLTSLFALGLAALAAF